MARHVGQRVYCVFAGEKKISCHKTKDAATKHARTRRAWGMKAAVRRLVVTERWKGLGGRKRRRK